MKQMLYGKNELTEEDLEVFFRDRKGWPASIAPAAGARRNGKPGGLAMWLPSVCGQQPRAMMEDKAPGLSVAHVCGGMSSLHMI